MKKNIFIVFVLMISFAACHNHKHEHNHDHDHDHGDHETEHVDGDENEDEENEEISKKYPGAIKFSKFQSEKIDFETAFPVAQSFGQVIKTTAQVLSSQNDEMIVAARTSGIVMFAGNTIVEGKTVNAGQQLFSVSSSGMADNNLGTKFVEVQNNYLKAESDYRRARELSKENVISEKDFLQVKSEYETSKASYDNLSRNFSPKGQSVSSPLAGFIKQLFVENGQFVEAGQPLVSVSKNKSLLLKAEVRTRYAALLPYVVSANIVSPDKSVVYSLDDLSGKILSFGRSVSDENSLLPVVFQIVNKAGFISGSFVDVYIKTKSEKPVMTIPNTALTEDQGIFFVFVELAPELYEKREVKTGVTDGVCTEVLSGLKDNEKIVTKGAISVKLAQTSGALDPHAGHVH